MSTTGLHPKVVIGTLAAATAGILISELNRHGVPIAPDEASYITLVFGAIAGFLAPAGDNGNGADPVPAPETGVLPAVPPPPLGLMPVPPPRPGVVGAPASNLASVAVPPPPPPPAPVAP